MGSKFPTYFGTDKPKLALKAIKMDEVHLSWREGNEKKREEKLERKESRNVCGTNQEGNSRQLC